MHRIKYVGNPANQAPTAVAAADKVSGGAPLTVRLDGTRSTDPDTRDAFTYAWDLDDDGAFDDSTSARPKSTFRRPGTRTVSVRVTDTGGLSDTDSLSIEITEPITTLTFSPTADARVEEVHPIDNYGASDKLRAALGPGMESFLRFQLSGINGPVRSAKLTLTAATNGTVDGPGVHSVSGDWSESDRDLGHQARPRRRPGVGRRRDRAQHQGGVRRQVARDRRRHARPRADPDVDGRRRAQLQGAPQRRRSGPCSRSRSRPRSTTRRRPRPPTSTAQADGQSRVDLSWTASTDNVGVTNYEIYRDGQLLDVVGNVTSYADTTVSVETPYEYTVRALDAEENRSAASNAAHGDGARQREPHDAGQPRGAGRGRGARRPVLDRVHRQRRRHELRDLPRRRSCSPRSGT